MDSAALEAFIDAWGSMGMLWGVNRSIARAHALLIATAEPLGLDDIARQLQISRGNASMCLKELRNWGVIRRVHVPGERRDYYVTEPDVWKMFFRILEVRKQREFDPALAAVQGALEAANEGTDDQVRERLAQMTDLLATMGKVMERFLSDEQTSRAMMRFVTGQLLVS